MKEKIQLDNLDKRILSALQHDASLNGITLAEAVSSSPASCWRRVRNLQDTGVLQKSVYLVDRMSVNKNVDIICMLRLISHNEQDASMFENFVIQQDNIVECYTVSGEWDYLLRIVECDIRSYNDFLKKVLLRHPTVAHANSQFALSRIKHTTAIPLE